MKMDKSLFMVNEFSEDYMRQLNDKVNLPADIEKFNNEIYGVYEYILDYDGDYGRGHIAKTVPNGIELAKPVYFNASKRMYLTYTNEWEKAVQNYPVILIGKEWVAEQRESVKLESSDDDENLGYYDKRDAYYGAESACKFDKIDASYMGVMNLVNYLFKMNPDQFVNHLQKVCHKMCLNRKINEVSSNPDDPKEVFRYYSALKMFKQLESAEKKVRKADPTHLIDYDDIYKKVCDRFHLKVDNLKSVFQAKKRANGTAKTMLVKGI